MNTHVRSSSHTRKEYCWISQKEWKITFCMIKSKQKSELRQGCQQTPLLITDNRHAEIQPFGPCQANLVLIAYASSEGSGEPAHPHSLTRTSAARSYKQWVKRNLQTESQIPGPSEWLGMRSYNLSWRNAQKHKFTWLGPFALWFRTEIVRKTAEVFIIGVK